MASPPRRPIKRKTDAPRDAVADRAVVAKAVDPRQAGLFDEPLPKWIRPCLPTLVDKTPARPQWVHRMERRASQPSFVRAHAAPPRPEQSDLSSTSATVVAMEIEFAPPVFRRSRDLLRLCSLACGCLRTPPSWRPSHDTGIAQPKRRFRRGHHDKRGHGHL